MCRLWQTCMNVKCRKKANTEGANLVNSKGPGVFHLLAQSHSFFAGTFAPCLRGRTTTTSSPAPCLCKLLMAVEKKHEKLLKPSNVDMCMYCMYSRATQQPHMRPTDNLVTKDFPISRRSFEQHNDEQPHGYIGGSGRGALSRETAITPLHVHVQ